MNHTRTFTVLAAAGVLAIGAGGTAVASGLIGSGDIRNQSIQSHDIAAGEVTSSELVNQGIRQVDVGRSAVGWGELTPFVRDRVAAEPAQAPAPLTGYEVIGPGSAARGEGVHTVTVPCFNNGGDDPYKVALGGGVKGSADLLASYPSDVTQVGADPNGESGIWHATSWTVKFEVPAGGSAQAYSLCATASK